MAISSRFESESVMKISIPKTNEPTDNEQIASIGAVTGPGMSATGKGVQSPNDIKKKEAARDCRPVRSTLSVALEGVLWFAVLLLASCVLLWWSASILLNCFVNGPSVARAASGAPIAVTSPAIAVIIMAVSFMRFDALRRRLVGDSSLPPNSLIEQRAAYCRWRWEADRGRLMASFA